MCIYHCMPVLDYTISAPAGQLLCTSVDDLPIPEFDNIGMESVPAVQLFNTSLFSSNASIKVDSILGYNPRYFNWKTNIDRIHGTFTTTLKDWVAPVQSTDLLNALTVRGDLPWCTLADLALVVGFRCGYVSFSKMNFCCLLLS